MQRSYQPCDQRLGPSGMSETQLTDGMDAIKELTGAALDAAGIGFTSVLWDFIFPEGDAMFSETQLEQLKTLFSQLLGEQSYQEALHKFESSARIANEYIDSGTKSPEIRAEFQTKTSDEAAEILAHGWSTAKIYLASMSLHILSLKFNYDATSNPDQKAAAGELIGSTALDLLTDLLVLEDAYAATVDWAEFANFKTFATKGVQNFVTPAALTAFGDDYPAQVQQLLGLVQTWVPDRLKEIPVAPYSMSFVPYDATLAPLTFKGYGSDGDGWLQDWLYMYQVQAVPPTLPAGFVPLCDLAKAPGNAQPDWQPPYVIYIAANASSLSAAGSFNHVWDDRGDHDDNQSVAVFTTTPGSVGSFTSTNDRASQPDYPQWAQLVDPAFITSVVPQYPMWSSNGMHSDQDSVAWSHPDLGIYGAYTMTRSFSTDSPTVPGLSMSPAIKGHPIYVPQPQPSS